jgi:cytochrome b subunit of formate dehydrogenase
MSSLNEAGAPVARRPISLESHLRVQYGFAIASVTVLVITGLPQKFDSLSLCRRVMDLAGGIETIRLIHHVAGGALILTGVYHVVQVLATVLVLGETAPLRMIPSLRDIRDAVKGTAYLVHMTDDPPGAGERQYIQKLDYWFLTWSFGVMALTGLVNLVPLRIATLLSAETVLASMRTHSDAALLVLAWVAIVHWPYAELTPRLFRRRAAASHVAQAAAVQVAAPRAVASSHEDAIGVAAAAERRLGELHANDGEGAP